MQDFGSIILGGALVISTQVIISLLGAYQDRGARSETRRAADRDRRRENLEALQDEVASFVDQRTQALTTVSERRAAAKAMNRVEDPEDLGLRIGSQTRLNALTARIHDADLSVLVDDFYSKFNTVATVPGPTGDVSGEDLRKAVRDLDTKIGFLYESLEEPKPLPRFRR